MVIGALRVYTRSAPLIWCATGNFLPIAIFLVVATATTVAVAYRNSARHQRMETWYG
jgi:hypothetical protein